jgi:small multidrug resistance family-3 protein
MISRTLILVAAALLETGGIALMRWGMQQSGVLIMVGAAGLVAYGVVVNQGGPDFGRLMGVYIAVFFVISQIIAVALFHQFPNTRTLIGGALIISGGVTILT